MDNYILSYYQAIKDGSVIVGNWIMMWYEAIVKGLESGLYSYNPKKAKSAIVFIENFARHHEGSLGGQHLKLELWQKALVSVLFGICDEDGTRHFREAFIVIARKNGKTLMASAIAEYMAYMDGEYGARVYFTAPKLEQANLAFDAFCQMVYKDETISQISQKRRTDIYIEQTNSTVKPLAFSAKKSDGLNISLAICDEVASWQGDQGLKYYEVIKSSFGARKQPLLLSISTAGYVNEGIYDELMKRATRVLMGESKETRFAPFIYSIDDTDRWNDINELAKANPNMGVSVSTDYLLDEIAIAEGSLSKKMEFLTKYCNIKQNSSQAWLSTKDIKGCIQNSIELEDFRNSYCVGGIDLSRTTDLTACTAVIEKNGILNVFTHFFMPSEKLEEASQRDGLPYHIYVAKGWLTLSGDNFVNYKDCYDWFVKLVEEYQIYPLQIGYDRYTAQYLIQDMNVYGFHTDDVFQGFNLSPVIKEFEGLLKDKKINIGDNDLMKVHLLDSAVKMDTETDRLRLIKLQANLHIDGTASLIDAMIVRQKYYKEIGEQLKNQ